MNIRTTGPFQHSKAARERQARSGFIAPNERRDCCTRCEHMVHRQRNPYCNLHRIFVQSWGLCKHIQPMKVLTDADNQPNV
jgi:hypothetical protein